MVTTIATRSAFQPKAPCRPCASRHLVGHVEGHIGEQHGKQCDDHATEAELGARLDHLREPEAGPGVACRAMNRVPTRIPAAPAVMVHPRDSPNAGPMKPIGMVKYWKLPRNHSGA